MAMAGVQVRVFTLAARSPESDMQWIIRFFGGLASRILAVTLAVAAAQFPLYYAQYLQTVAGARQEAEMRYQALVREAGAVNLNAQDFIVRHEQNGDPVFQASGRLHRQTLLRFEALDTSFKALSSAGLLQKPAALAQHFDRSLLPAVRFTPGLNFTVETGAYALAGLLLAWLISAAFGGLLLPPQRPKLSQQSG
jgi:hypothetical protein